MRERVQIRNLPNCGSDGEICASRVAGPCDSTEKQETSECVCEIIRGLEHTASVFCKHADKVHRKNH